MRRSIARITTAVFIFTFFCGFNTSSAVATPPGVIALAWHDDTPGNYEIYLKTSLDNGATWSAAKRLTNNSGESAVPSIAASGSNIHIAWHDNTPGNYEIYIKTSLNNGAAWSEAKRLTNNAGGSYVPSLAR